MQRDRLIPELIAGKGDIAVGGLTVTEGRKKKVDFSRITSYNVCYTKLLRDGKRLHNFNEICGIGNKIISGETTKIFPAMATPKILEADIPGNQPLLADTDDIKTLFEHERPGLLSIRLGVKGNEWLGDVHGGKILEKYFL